MKMLIRFFFFLLLITLACTSGDSGGKVRPVGESTAVPATDPDTVVRQPAPAALAPGKKAAQRAWDTAAPESFDVEELNRKRAERPAPESESEPVPLTREDTIEMLLKIKPDENGAFSYMKPSDYPGLPANIADWLEKRNYVIPQIEPPVFQYIEKDWGPCNVIIGNFIRPDQTDWAVYCTKGQETRIFIFTEAYTDSIISIERNLKTNDDLDCCSDWINSITPKTLVDYHELIESQRSFQTPVIDHNGISVGSYDFSNYELYFSMGRWYVFVSTDDE